MQNYTDEKKKNNLMKILYSLLFCAILLNIQCAVIIYNNIDFKLPIKELKTKTEKWNPFGVITKIPKVDTVSIELTDKYDNKYAYLEIEYIVEDKFINSFANDDDYKFYRSRGNYKGWRDSDLKLLSIWIVSQEISNGNNDYEIRNKLAEAYKKIGLSVRMLDFYEKVPDRENPNG